MGGLLESLLVHNIMYFLDHVLIFFFKFQDKTQAKNRFKFHVKLAKMPKDIFDLVMEIGQNWSGKKEFNQVTVRGCFYLPDKEIREALLKLRDIGEAAFKEYV